MTIDAQWPRIVLRWRPAYGERWRPVGAASGSPPPASIQECLHMGVFSSQGTERQRGTRRTIWSTFAVMVAAPVACLVVLWGLVLGGVIGGAIGGPDTPSHDHEVVVGFVAVTGMGLAIIVAAVVMMGLFARRLAQDITDLEATARHLAEEQMPEVVERLRRG